MCFVKQTMDRVAQEQLKEGLALLQDRFSLQDFEKDLLSLKLKITARNMKVDPANYLHGIFFHTLKRMNWQVSKETLLKGDFQALLR